MEEIIGTKLPFNLATTTLKIKTGPTLNPGQKIDVKFYTTSGEEAGQIELELGGDTLKYKLGFCMSASQEFQADNGNVDGDVWGIRGGSGKDVVVTCNGVVC